MKTKRQGSGLFEIVCSYPIYGSMDEFTGYKSKVVASFQTESELLDACADMDFDEDLSYDFYNPDGSDFKFPPVPPVEFDRLNGRSYASVLY